MIVTYDNGASNAVRRVYVDGKAMSLVIRADDEAGMVLRYVADEKGNPKMVGKEFATITEIGKVEIELNYGWRYNTVTQSFALLPKHMLQ